MTRRKQSRSKKQSKGKEEGKERRRGYLIKSSVVIIKGRYLEFKYRMILTLSPIYNDDLQGLSHL